MDNPPLLFRARLGHFSAMGIHIPSALAGEIIVFGIFALIVWALVREAARMIIRVMLVVAIGIAVALMAGWLDESAVGAFLEQVGEWLMAGITGVVHFFVGVWNNINA